MRLGNNRDYTTRDRATRKRLSVLKDRTTEIAAETGKDAVAAYAQASTELTEGKLNNRLKTWVDPILAHKRLMHFKNSLQTGELYVTITHDAPGWPGWTWAVEGWDDGAVRVLDLTSYKTQKAMIAAIDASDTYRNFKRFRKQ